jgi:murein DD-endopeptidase MepM/ murein hydrolase activator NlpD
MPPKFRDVTFEGWLEDIVKSPKSIAEQTYAIYRDRYKNLWMLNVNALAAQGSSDIDLIAAFSEGPETVADIKGVNMRVSAVDLVNAPKETLSKLWGSSLSQILDLNEVGQDRRASYADLLVKGKTQDETGRDLDTLESPVLKAPLIRNIFTPGKGDVIVTDPTGTKQSAIRLLTKQAPPTGSIAKEAWEDRRVAETGTKDYKVKAYANLASSFKSLSDTMEDRNWRKVHYQGILLNYNRALAQEIGLDIDGILGVNASGFKDGKFIEGGLNYGKESYKNGRMFIVGSAGGTSEWSVQDIISNDTKLAAVLGIDETKLAKLRPQTREWINNWLVTEELNLRGSFIEYVKPQTGAELIERWKAAKLKPDLSGVSYTGTGRGSSDRNFARSDYAQVYQREVVNSWLQAEQASTKISADISGDTLGLLSGKIGTSTKSDTLERLRAARKTAEIANDMFYAGTVEDLLESIEQGSLTKALIVNTRLLNSLPYNSPLLRNTADIITWFDPGTNKFTRSATKFLSVEVPDRLGLAFTSNGTKIDDLMKKETREELAAKIASIKASGKNPGFYDKAELAFATLSAKTRFLDLKRIPGGWKDSWASIEWEDAPHAWNMRMVKAKKLQGIFGSTFIDASGKLNNSSVGIFEFLQSIDNLEDTIKAPLGIISASEFFKEDSLSSLTDLLDRITSITDPTVVDPNLLAMVKKMGLLVDDGSGNLIFSPGFESLKNEYNNFKNSGLNFLTKDLKKWKVDKTKRWEMILNISRQGKVKQFTQLFAGPLANINRFQNHLRNKLYKQVIFGKKVTLFGRDITRAFKPLQKILSKLGLSDEIMLNGAVKRWMWVKRLKGTGAVFQSYYKTGTLTKAQSKFLGKMFGVLGKIPGAKSLVGRLLKGAFGKALLRGLGLLLTSASGLVTGGISWVVMALGSIVMEFGKNALQFKFKQAFQAAWKETKKKLDVLKKVILYPLTCCVTTCLGLILIVVMLVGTILAPLEKILGTIREAVRLGESKLVKVEKSHIVMDDYVQYTITITVPADSPSETVKIFSVEDDMFFTYPCNVTPELRGKTFSYTETGTNQFIGNIEQIMLTRANGENEMLSLSEFDLFNLYTNNELIRGDPNSKITIIYNLTNYKDNDSFTGGNGTYTNTVKVKAGGVTESNKYATATDIFVRGTGGCDTCPSGWPVDKGYITQGPEGTFSHSTAEAIDIGPNVKGGGTLTVRATHGGTVEFSTDPNCVKTVPVEARSMGCYVKITGAGYSTTFMHLVAPNTYNLTNGQHVSKGTPVGRMGNSGSSTGVHLHYQFNNPTFRCIEEYPLRMVKIPVPPGNGQNYLPISIKRGCKDYVSCGAISF